jgi:hypothetical protein
LQFTYRELIDRAGVSREAIAEALAEAIRRRFIRCVRPPQPHRSGAPAQSGRYELRWDDRGPYTHRPDEFQGFSLAEAVVESHEPGSRGPCARVTRRNIPNAFFDYLLPREPLSVIRVVGALLFYSIRWGKGGERKVPVSCSVSHLSKLMRMSRSHVHAALWQAIERGYVELHRAGAFDPQAGAASEAATYRIRWVEGLSPAEWQARVPNAVPPLQTEEPAGVTPAPVPSAPVPERSEKVNGATVKKGERDRSEKVNGQRSEKVNGIDNKTDNKTLETTTAGADAGAGTAGAAAAAIGPVVDLLIKTGFDIERARELAERHPAEVIRQQVEWLPLRTASTSRLGLLRRAIEQNWSKPEPNPPVVSPELQAGADFARHYYAGYHGHAGEPTAEPFSHDALLAQKLVEQLQATKTEGADVAEWGRRFGRFVRTKHQSDAGARPHLSAAITLYGDEFVRTAQGQAQRSQRLALRQARDAHVLACRADYLAYLRQAEAACRAKCPDQYARFEASRAEQRAALTNGMLRDPDKVLARFEREECRLEAFAEFFAGDPEPPVLDFWHWDARHNPNRFRSSGSPVSPRAARSDPTAASGDAAGGRRLTAPAPG